MEKERGRTLEEEGGASKVTVVMVWRATRSLKRSMIAQSIKKMRTRSIFNNMLMVEMVAIACGDVTNKITVLDIIF